MNAKLLTFDRSDYRATKVLMILLAICAPAVLLGLPVYDLAAGNPLRVYLPAGALAPISVADGVSVTPWGVVSVEAVGASIGTWVLSLVPPLVVVVALWVALLFLWRSLASIYDPNKRIRLTPTTTTAELDWGANRSVNRFVPSLSSNPVATEVTSRSIVPMEAELQILEISPA